MPTLADILTSLQTAQDAAKQANESRYQEILGILRGAQTQGMAGLDAAGQVFKDRAANVEGLLQNSGNAARVEAGRQFNANVAAGTQDLISHGMAGNPIVAQAMRRRASEDFQRNLESIRQQTDQTRAGAMMQTQGDLGNFMLNRVGVESGLAGNVAGAIERRTDQYPDLSPYIDLINQLNQAQAGTPQKSYSVTNAGGKGGGGGSYGGGAGKLAGGSGPSSYASSGGGGGGGGGGVYTVTGAGNPGPTSTPNFGGGGSMFLGGRALGPDGSLQGVNLPSGGLQNPGYGQVRSPSTGQSSGYSSGLLPPNMGGGSTPDPLTDRLNQANQGAGASAGAGSAPPPDAGGNQRWEDTWFTDPATHPTFAGDLSWRWNDSTRSWNVLRAR